ncbi:MAG: amino acid adenylation domain-containing protein [Cyanobacteria bacterium P01_C01_bin.70]
MLQSCASALVHQQFELQVGRTPDAIALVDQEQQYTYRQLNARANQLARFLQRQGVRPEVLVGICLPRSSELIIAMLATLKAGGAYVPMDPSYPVERLKMMQTDAQMPLLLTNRAGQSDWMLSDTTQVICLDAQLEDIAQELEADLLCQVQPHNLAYVIYTSGSTGKPKGVMIEHRSITAYAQTAGAAYDLQPGDRVLQFCSISFDTAAEEIFCCLVQGSTLVLRTDEMIGSVQAFLERSQAWGITIWVFPTAFWHFLATELARTGLTPPASLRLVTMGGEKAIPAQLAQWRQQVGEHIRLVNTYGPTEATIVSTMCDIAGPEAVDGAETSPIGQAISQVQTYVLDETRQPVAPGTAGELYIGGIGVGRGYLNRPEITAERFLPDPFAADATARMYKSGDRVRDRGDGILEFLGRADHQVKIRGFRVELFEIEAVLNQHSAVQEGIVLAPEDVLGNKRLVAYVLPNDPQATTDNGWIAALKSHLQTQLPSYMVPAQFCVLESLPLTPSGKVDRKALSALDDLSSAPLAPEDQPQTALEKQVAEIWSQVLRIPAVGLYDNFFELGGSSLLAAQLVSFIAQDLSIELPIRCVYESPTVVTLAQTLEILQEAEGNTLSVLTDLTTQVIPQPPVIQARRRQQSHPVAPKTVFLTGATGFLGAFLLHELLQQTQAEVFCLVRADSRREGFARLQATFTKYGLPVASLKGRAVPVPGNLNQPRLGLSESQFARLASRVDVIYHSGAMVNFVKPYSALEAENVLGTREILKLAGQEQLKPVNYISTVGVFGAIAYFTDQTTVYEDDDLDISRDFLCWDDGYAQSKWVAEKMLLAAKAQGLPITVFRPGFIAGDSRTGATNMRDFLSRSLLGCIQFGAYPDLAKFKNQVITVDYASQAILHISQQPESSGGTFHITPWSSTQDFAWNDLFKWAQDYGYPLRRLSYSRWKEQLSQHCRHRQDNALYPLLPFLNEKIYKQQLTILELYENTADFDCSNAIAALEGSSIQCPVVDQQKLFTYLDTFVHQQELPQPQPVSLSA